MEKAKVYFTDMRAYPGKENLLQKYINLNNPDFYV